MDYRRRPPQHRVWAEIVANLPKPLAVVAVDAMRYEIGVELADRLVRPPR